MELDSRCTLCRTELDHVSRQPIDHRFEAHFLKCSLCGKAHQIVVASDFARKSGR